MRCDHKQIPDPNNPMEALAMVDLGNTNQPADGMASKISGRREGFFAEPNKATAELFRYPMFVRISVRSV